MQKNLLQFVTAGTILLFAAQSSAQEISDLLSESKKLPTTELTMKEIGDTLITPISYKSYEFERDKIFSDFSNVRYKDNFTELLDIYLIQNEHQILQDPISLKNELTMIYYDCEFADIEVPEKLRYMLGLIDFQYIE